MDSITREVPRQDWMAFMSSVIRVYAGYRATIEVLSGVYGDQHVADSLPFQGITYEVVGSAAGHLMIEVGDLPEFTIHHVCHPRCVHVALTRPGYQTDMQFKDEDGSITLLCLRSPTALPPGPSANGAARLRPRRRVVNALRDTGQRWASAREDNP